MDSAAADVPSQNSIEAMQAAKINNGSYAGFEFMQFENSTSRWKMKVVCGGQTGRIFTLPPFSPSPPPREERVGVRRRQCFQIKSPHPSPLPVWAGRGSQEQCQDAPGRTGF